MDHPTEEHRKTFEEVHRVLKQNKVDYKFYHREKLNEINFDIFELAIIIGGDGTFLRASHFITNTLILGINSDVNKKEGFFMQTNRKKFVRDFELILDGKYKIKKSLRLECKINDKKLPDFCLNEVYIGSKQPYHMSRYNLRVKGINENQKSSGLLISTPSGSNAWVKSAGGKVIDKGFEYFIREPYDGKLMVHKLKQGLLKNDEKVIVKSMMKNGIIVIDSLSEEYEFNQGDKLVVNVGKPLNYILIR